MASHNIDYTRPNGDANHIITKEHNFESNDDLKSGDKTIETKLKSKHCERLWPVFVAVFVIGLILLAVGVFLTVLGNISLEKDFVIIGSCGIFLGLCFQFISVYRWFKTVHFKFMGKENSNQRNNRSLLPEEITTCTSVFKRSILKSMQLQKLGNSIKRVYFSTDNGELDTDAQVVLLKHVSINDQCDGSCVCCKLTKEQCNGSCVCCKLAKEQCNDKCVCCKQVAAKQYKEVNHNPPIDNTYNRQKVRIKRDFSAMTELDVYNNSEFQKKSHIDFSGRRDTALSKNMPNNKDVLITPASAKRQASKQQHKSLDSHKIQVSCSGLQSYQSQVSPCSHQPNHVHGQTGTKLLTQSPDLPRNHFSVHVDVAPSHRSSNHNVDLPTSHHYSNQNVVLPPSHPSSNQHVDLPTSHPFSNQNEDLPTSHPSSNQNVDLPPSHHSSNQNVVLPPSHPSSNQHIDLHPRHPSSNPSSNQISSKLKSRPTSVKCKPQLKLAIGQTKQSECCPANQGNGTITEAIPVVIPTDTRLLRKHVQTLAEVCIYNTHTNFCDSGKSSIESDSMLDYDAPQKEFAEDFQLNSSDSFVFDFTQQTQKNLSSCSDVIMRAIGLPASDTNSNRRPVVGMSQLDDRIEIWTD